MIPSALSVPFWIPLSRNLGKVRLWILSMILSGISFGSFFFLLFIEDVFTKIVYVCIAAFFAGLANGCGSTIAPSVQADTGERKEGSYFAAWSFIYKASAGVMLMLTGFSLQFAGFLPNQEQTFEVKFVLLTLYALFPLSCCLIGSYLLTKFKLNEEEYKIIRQALNERET